MNRLDLRRRLTGDGSVVLLAGIGVFIAALDQTSVVTVLPKMIEDVGLSQDRFYRAAWIVNAYILGYVVAMPLMGRIADLYGRGRIFAAALGLFIAGSIWVALANDLTTLSIARGVQAIGGGAVVPVSMAIVMENASPGRRAVGLGAMAAAAEAGGLLGPLWGGVLAELFGWRSMFWINLPLCLPIVWVLWRSSSARPVTRGGIDYLGATLLAGALVFLTIALTDDPVEPRPDGVSLGLYVGAVVLFIGFVRRQTSASPPLVDLGLLRDRALAAGFLTNTLVGGCLIVAMVSVPLFTNVILQGSSLEGGLNLMRLTVALPIGAVAGGHLVTRIGPARAAAIGLAAAGAGFLTMTTWSTDVSFFELTLPLLLAGLGFGLVIAPVNEGVLGGVPASDHATVASLLTVVRLLGALVGVALLTTRGLGGFYQEAGLVPLDDPRFIERVTALEIQSFHEIFIATAAVCFLAILPALLLGRRNAPILDVGTKL